MKHEWRDLGIDMLRILENISSHKLNQCELTCEFDQGQKSLF